MIVDLFCGAGGWAAGLDMLGVDPDDTVGLEWNEDAAATHEAAGFPTLLVDIAETDPAEVTEGRAVDGLIASPPCQAFSMAGKGRGRSAIVELLAHVDACRDGWVAPSASLCAEDVRADLTLEPIRWADALRPRWIAWEQVPAVLPLWEHAARILEEWGYSTWTGTLKTERYGVPQTRRRAILLARRDGLPCVPPDPTHTEYDHRLGDGGRTPTPTLLGPDLLPWVSMADALGWSGLDPAEVELVANAQTNAARRRGDQPAPAITGGHDTNDRRWRYAPDGVGDTERTGVRNRTVDEPANAVTGGGTAYWHGPGDPPWITARNDQSGASPADADWPLDRPATAVAGRGLIGDPGANANRHNDSDKSRNDGIRVSPDEAAALQSFPPDWPWKGSKTSRYQQIGNAVPPRLAAAVLRPLVTEETER